VIQLRMPVSLGRLPVSVAVIFFLFSRYRLRLFELIPFYFYRVSACIYPLISGGNPSAFRRIGRIQGESAAHLVFISFTCPFTVLQVQENRLNLQDLTGIPYHSSNFARDTNAVNWV
jgi:hypothetical protein